MSFMLHDQVSRNDCRERQPSLRPVFTCFLLCVAACHYRTKRWQLNTAA